MQDGQHEQLACAGACQLSWTPALAATAEALARSHILGLVLRAGKWNAGRQSLLVRRWRSGDAQTLARSDCDLPWPLLICGASSRFPATAWLKSCRNMAPKRSAAKAAARASAAQARPAPPKVRRRADRRQAARDISLAASAAGLQPLPRHASAAAVRKLVVEARARLAGRPEADVLEAAWKQWAPRSGDAAHGAAAAAGGEEETASGGAGEEEGGDGDEGQDGVLRLRPAGAFRVRSHAFMLTFNSRSLTQEVWPAFRAWVAERQKSLGARAWAAAIEQSCHAAPSRAAAGSQASEGAAASADSGAKEEDIVHLHAYLYWSNRKGYSARSTEGLRFQGIQPRVDVCSETRGPAQFKMAAMHGLWYVAVGKTGTLHTDSNFKPWRDYCPQGAWLRSLWNWHKLSHERYLQLSVEFRSGHAARKREAEEVIRDETESVEREEKTRARQAVYAALQQPQALTSIEETHTAQFKKDAVRYKALVYDGPSGTGKSVRAAQLYGAEAAFIVDCQNASVPDLRGLSREKHSCLVLDEVPGVAFALANKRLLMSHIDGAKLGQSATQMYSYNVWWWKKPIILTSNKWRSSYEEASPEDKDWLDKNILYQPLSAPLHA